MVSWFFVIHKILVTFDLLEIWFFNNTYMILCQLFPKSLSPLTSTTFSQGDQSHPFPGCWARRCTQTHGEGTHKRLGHKKMWGNRVLIPKNQVYAAIKLIGCICRRLSLASDSWEQCDPRTVQKGKKSGDFGKLEHSKNWKIRKTAAPPFIEPLWAYELRTNAICKKIGIYFPKLYCLQCITLFYEMDEKHRSNGFITSHNTNTQPTTVFVWGEAGIQGPYNNWDNLQPLLRLFFPEPPWPSAREAPDWLT